MTTSDETGNFFYLSLRGDDFCDDVWRSTNGGQIIHRSSRPTEPGTEATSNGSLSTQTGGHWSWISSTNFGPSFFACDFGAFNRSTRQWGDLVKVRSVLREFYRYRSARGRHQRQSVCWRSRRQRRVQVPSLQSNAQNPTGHANRFRSKRYWSTLVAILIQGGINGIGLCGQTFVAVDRTGTNNNVYMLASVIPFGCWQRH